MTNNKIKHISPNVAYFMGIFMMFSAVIYTSVVNTFWDLSTVDVGFRLFIGIPTFLLTIGGCATCIYALRIRPLLEYSIEDDAWVRK